MSFQREEDRKTGYSQSGNTICYQAQYLRYKIVDGISKENWKPIETSRNPHGIPCSRHDGEMFSLIHYQSYSQAKALCWWFLAAWDAREVDIEEIGRQCPKVRMQAYDFIYSMKTYQKDTIAVWPEDNKKPQTPGGE